MTAFAATFVQARLVVQAASGDELAIEVLRGIVSTVEFYEGKTDAELTDWIASHSRSQRLLAEERDWDEWENHSYEASICEAVLGYRAEVREHTAAVARYTGQGSLTHRPFAGLVLA